MPEGPLGFPRATSIGPFVEEDDMGISDENIVNAADNADYDFTIESVKSGSKYWQGWQNSDNATRGITGSYASKLNTMVVDVRGETHHNEQLRYLIDKYDEDSFDILTWAVLPSGDWFADVPATGATMRGAIRRMNTDVTAVDADEVHEADLWSTVYTSYMLDVPFQTQVTFRYTPRRLSGVASGSDIKEEKFEIGVAYRQLSFVLAGLPEPKLNREQYRF